MSAKKVLFLINNFGRGGAERAFANQVNLFVKTNVDVRVATLVPNKADGYDAELLVAPEQRTSFVYRGLLDLKTLRELSRYIREQGIETVYSTLELSNIVARLLKIYNPRLRVINRLSGTGTVDVAGRANLKIWKFKIIDMVLNFWVDKIIVLTDEMRMLSAAYQPWHKNRFAVIPNGVNIIDAESEIRNRNQKKMQQSVWTCIMVGSMDVSERAYEYIIAAAALIPAVERANWKFMFIGAGSLLQGYQQLARERGVADIIEFRGKLPTEELRNAYRSAHIHLLCSLSEGFPNVLLEAQSFGLPVVTTRVGGATDVVVDGQTGFFVGFKDAQGIYDKFTWLRAHPQEWSDMGAAGYVRVKEQFSLDIVMQRISAVLFPIQPN